MFSEIAIFGTMHSISNFPEDSFLQCIVIPTANPSVYLIKFKNSTYYSCYFVRTYVRVNAFFCCSYSMTESVEAHLLHPHAWVRLVSSRLLGLLFAAWKPEELVTGYQKRATSLDYLQENLPTKVKILFFFVGFVCFTTAETILFGHNHGHFVTIIICERRINFYFALLLLRKFIIQWHLIHVQFSNLTVTNVEQELL